MRKSIDFLPVKHSIVFLCCAAADLLGLLILYGLKRFSVTVVRPGSDYDALKLV
jgi:hypothetical protein